MVRANEIPARTRIKSIGRNCVLGPSYTVGSNLSTALKAGCLLHDLDLDLDYSALLIEPQPSYSALVAESIEVPESICRTWIFSSFDSQDSC